jgi:predicted nucleic acid-binding protein
MAWVEATIGFVATLASDDHRHAAAAKVLARARKCKRRSVTADYVLNASATPLKTRLKAPVLAQLNEHFNNSRVYRFEWTESERFHGVRTFLLKHADNDGRSTVA